MKETTTVKIRVYRFCSYFALLALLTTGCSTLPLASPEKDRQAKAMTPSSDTCLIYVIRKNQFTGSAMLYSVTLDQTIIGPLSSGTYYLLEVSPGVHTVYRPPIAWGDNANQVNLQCENGQIFYILAISGLTKITFGQVPELTARKELASCKLIKTASFAEKPKPAPVRERVEEEPKITSETLLVKALEARDKGHDSEAFSYLSFAMRIDPNNPKPFQHAGDLLMKFCDLDGAIGVTERGLKSSPHDRVLQYMVDRARGQKSEPSPQNEACRAQELHREGVALISEGKNVDALEKFEEAVQTSPGAVPEAHYKAGLILERLGRPDEALAHYVKARESSLLPEDEIAALTKLVALTRRTKISAPETADRRYRVGIIRTQQRRYEEAVEELQSAIAEAPWLMDAYYYLGFVYDFNKEYPKALRVLRIYAKLAPNTKNIDSIKTKIVELEDRLGLLDTPNQ